MIYQCISESLHPYFKIMKFHPISTINTYPSPNSVSMVMSAAWRFLPHSESMGTIGVRGLVAATITCGDPPGLCMIYKHIVQVYLTWCSRIN